MYIIIAYIKIRSYTQTGIIWGKFMEKLIKITDGFLTAHKNKITLISIAFIFVCHIMYFIASGDSVYVKILMAFMSSAAFLGAFYGIKLVLIIRNRFAPLSRVIGYIFDMLCVFAALFLTAAFLYDFVLSFDGFDLVIFSIVLAFLNAVALTRVKVKK